VRGPWGCLGGRGGARSGMWVCGYEYHWKVTTCTGAGGHGVRVKKKCCESSGGTWRVRARPPCNLYAQMATVCDHCRWGGAQGDGGAGRVRGGSVGMGWTRNGCAGMEALTLVVGLWALFNARTCKTR
jgi:hypothetical protein